MTARTRASLLLFALIGLVVSAWAAVIHHRLLVDPGYVSPCDINAHFNCSQVYLSEYGSIHGVPVALGGVFWFGLVASVAAFARPLRGSREDATGSYLFLLALVGLAAVLYLGTASLFVLETACVLCLTTYACVIAIVAVSAGARSVPIARVPSLLARDLRTAVTSRIALGVAAVLVVGLVWAAKAFVSPPGPETASAPPSLEKGDAGSGTSAAAAGPRAAFEAAWARQPRVDAGVSPDGAKVVIVKFLDWECPTCKLTDEWYRPVLEHFQSAAPGAVKYVEKDFPLDPKCNFASPRQLHPAPCEAAAAVRLAAEHGKRPAMIEWIFAHQSSGVNAVAAASERLLGISDFASQYARVLPAIRQDISDGAALKLTGTPTIFINGVQCPPRPLSATYFQIAIEYELARAGSDVSAIAK